MAKRLSLSLLMALWCVAPAFGQSYTLTPSIYQLLVDNAGTPINNGCVWTYQAGTTTPATTYVDTSGTTNTNPIRSDAAGRYRAYLLAGQNYKFVAENNDCVPPAHGTVLWTQDNIAGIPSSAATVDVTGTTGETINAGLCGYLSDGSGGKNAGQWYKCDSATTYSSATAVAVGIALSSIPSGSSGTFRINGTVSGLTSLSVGTTYYVGTAGAFITTIATNNRRLGIADTTSSLIMNAAGVFSPAFYLLGSTSGTLMLKVAAIAGAGSTLTFPAGTTDFTATGGSNQVVLQQSLGASFTVGQLSSGALSDTANIPLLNANQTFTGTNRFNGHVGINTAAPSNQFVSFGGTYTIPAGFSFVDIPANITLTSGGNGFQFQTAGAFITAASGTHALVSALQVSTGLTDTGATITNYVGIDIPAIPAFAHVTTATGLRVAAPTGAGTNMAINVTSGDIFKAGTAYTNPDYVFEHWATGRIERFAANEGADRYDGLRALAHVESSVRTSFMLPRLAEWRASDPRKRGLFGGGDAILASVEEAYLYLFQHEARIAQLEAQLKAMNRGTP